MTDVQNGLGNLTRLSEPILYGISSAATAIEGRSPRSGELSIWDVFAAAPGRVTDGTVPSMGPRHLERWAEDVALLAELGVDVYRFSLPWAALAGSPGPELDFYDRLIDALLDHGIRPMVTLTHYEMPLELMERGGWLVPEAAAEFADWTSRIAAPLADRVDGWVTMNSPLVHTAYGYGLGIEAPGLTLLGGALHVAQNQLIGHGLALQALRTAGAKQVGIANAHTRVTAAGDSPPDEHAAELYDALHNRTFTDPLFGCGWPTLLHDLPGSPADSLSAADLALISAPLDFYGVNYYYPQRVAFDPQNATIPFALHEPTPDERTDEFGWPVDPSALTSVLTTLTTRYPALPELWVTENGTQDSGGLADAHRGDYLTAHVGAVAAAVAAGSDVAAYLHWSLLDGWEFAEGLSRRFGLVAVDPDTGDRTPKASYQVYRDLIAGPTT